MRGWEPDAWWSLWPSWRHWCYLLEFCSCVPCCVLPCPLPLGFLWKPPERFVHIPTCIWLYHYFLIPAVPPEAFIALSFPGGASGKEPVCQCRRFKRCGFDPGVWKIPWRRKWQPSPIFLPGESHGQRSLMSYSPWGHTVRHNEVT